MRTALLVPSKPSPWTPSLHAALASAFSLDIIALGPEEPIPDLQQFDVIISRLKFRHLMALPTTDWGGCSGLRIHFDEDGFWDALWSASTYTGQWRTHIPRHQFHRLVVTGSRAQEHFETHGIRTMLVHKGFDPAVFRDHGGERLAALVTYGADYPSRVLARRVLQDAGVPVERIRAPFSQLGDALNGYLAALVCTLDGRVRGGSVGRALYRRFPKPFVAVGPGPEPMLKLFESVASGCATFCDWTPDLEGLGFVDGENIITYRDLGELAEKARHYLSRPDDLRLIGTNGALLAVGRHTWEHRATDLRGQIDAALTSV